MLLPDLVPKQTCLQNTLVASFKTEENGSDFNGCLVGGVLRRAEST
jgi:hypothetical protein